MPTRALQQVFVRGGYSIAYDRSFVVVPQVWPELLYCCRLPTQRLSCELCYSRTFGIKMHLMII